MIAENSFEEENNISKDNKNSPNWEKIFSKNKLFHGL